MVGYELEKVRVDMESYEYTRLFFKGPLEYSTRTSKSKMFRLYLNVCRVVRVIYAEETVVLTETSSAGFTIVLRCA